MANTLVTLIKGDESAITNTEVLDGQILFDETNKKIYLDDNSQRDAYGGFDNSDQIAYVESGTTATRGYATGAYVIVNNKLYKATRQINSGTAFSVGYNITETKMGIELAQTNSNVSIRNVRYNTSTGNLQYYNGSTWTNIPIGGGSMVAYDFSNPVHSFTSGNLTYIVPNDGDKYYLVGTAHAVASTKINNTTIAYNGTSYGGGFIDVLLSANDTIVTSSACDDLHVFKEV